MTTQRIKPYQLMTIQLLTSTRRRVIETISYPFPANNDGTGEQRIKARMVPGDSTTLAEVEVADLKTCKRKGKYCHVAEVRSGLGFPEDMLRYDGAALYDHAVHEEGEPYPIRGGRRGIRSNEPILIYQVSDNKQPTWTTARWLSFSANVKHLHTAEIGRE